MARRGILGLVAVGAVGVLGGCGLLGGTKSYRFRMTIEIETPQGLKSGSSVMEITAYKKMKLTSEEHARDWEVKGEAVVVDLPDGPMFVLMKTGNGLREDLALMSMGALDPEFKNDVVESAGRIAGSWSTLRGDVRREDWPLMVRFRDINDPKSVVKINPETVGVKRIVVETTSDEVTTGIEKRLGWLSAHRGALAYDGRMHPDHPEKDLNQNAFSTELQ